MINVFELIIILLGLLSSFILFNKYPTIKSNKETKINNKQKISIIIPCRNEEDKIGLLLEDLMHQNILIHEVIVVNDQSEDKSVDVISKYPVKLINVIKKDPSYLGKSYAIEYGSTFATGDIFIFIDSDVRLKTHAISSLISTYNAHNLTISIQPYHEVNRLYEALSIPFNMIQLAANHVTTMYGASFGLYGPLILMSKKTYELIGKHSNVKDSMIEDVSLGIELKKYNLEFNNYIGRDLFKIRMYPNGVKSLYQGWIKNFSFGASKTNLFTFILVFLFIASILANSIGFLKSIVNLNIELLLFSLSIYFFWNLRLSFIYKKIGNFKKTSLLIHPLLIINFCITFMISLFKKIFKLPFTWKNRKVK